MLSAKKGFSISATVTAEYILKRIYFCEYCSVYSDKRTNHFKFICATYFALCSCRNAMYWQKVIELVILQNACIAKRGSDVILIKRKGWEGGKLIYTLSLSWPPTCTRINTNTKHKDKDTRTKLQKSFHTPPFSWLPTWIGSGTCTNTSFRPTATLLTWQPFLTPNVVKQHNFAKYFHYTKHEQ